MASANDMFQKVGRATATTLSAPGYTTGDSSVNIGSTTNWPTDTGVTFAIDVVDAAGERIAGTYNVFRGRVAGASQVDQVVYEGGDAHRSYPSGATTRVYILVSSYRDNRMVDGLMISHNQDGTIKGPSVVTALTGQTLPANTVTTPAITDASVTPSKLSLAMQTASSNPYVITASTSYVDIGTALAVTVTVGANGAAEVILTAEITNNTTGHQALMSFAASGANTIAADDSRALKVLAPVSNYPFQMSRVVTLTGLTPGSTTFTTKYKAAAQTATYSYREITVKPL